MQPGIGNADNVTLIEKAGGTLVRLLSNGSPEAKADAANALSKLVDLAKSASGTVATNSRAITKIAHGAAANALR